MHILLKNKPLIFSDSMLSWPLVGELTTRIPTRSGSSLRVKNMLIDSEDVKSQFTENLQRLMDHVMSRFSDFPLIFWDKKESEENTGYSLL